MQKQSYENAKKRITSELDYILKDSSGAIITGWLKVRGTFRDWTKLWAILKPGLILFYRDLPSLVCYLELLFILINSFFFVEWCLGWYDYFIVMSRFIFFLNS